MDESAFDTYRRLARELDRLYDEGKGDTPEYEAVCDRMDAPWYAMTAEEQAKVRREASERNRQRRRVAGQEVK